MRLCHLHLPGVTSYHRASAIQDHLVRALLSFKATSPDQDHIPPAPTLITAQFHPIYTTGRRDITRVTPDQISALRSTGAEFHTALRGGQTTFHGPGQLIAYPIIDLKRHGLDTRSYVCALEKAVRGTCARFGIDTIPTPKGTPGVWISEDEKIAALGVHLRRFVSSHGVGLNVCTDLTWFDHIVACGLEGKRVVSFETVGATDVSVEMAGEVFVREMVEQLDGVSGIEQVGLQDIGIASGELDDASIDK